jgi:hypothetical protein
VTYKPREVDMLLITFICHTCSLTSIPMYLLLQDGRAFEELCQVEDQSRGQYHDVLSFVPVRSYNASSARVLDEDRADTGSGWL